MKNWINDETSIAIPLLSRPSPPPPPPLSETSLESKISPSILLIIVILAVIFFISGLLHLLVRYLLRPANRETEELDNVTALQGQLQQLFQLHDSGVDQSYIDNLPVFFYRAIIGLKDPFDCAVCLCEFEPHDKLRLLPKCSHAFHIECIDTWLLSHSTCPLCRSSLLPDFSSPHSSCSPVVLVLESGSESFRDFGVASIDNLQDEDLGPSISKRSEIGGKEDAAPVAVAVDVSETKVVQVKLGKFRNVDASVDGGEGSSSGNKQLDQRRCFSMGSYEYVMNEASLLQVAIKPSKKKPGRAKKPGSRLAMSECDFHSTREPFKGLDSKDVGGGGASARLGSSKKDSFSISKIWLRNKKDKAVSEEGGSRRAFSFRLPLHREPAATVKSSVSPRTISEVGDCAGSEVDLDLEVGSCNNSIVSTTGSQIEHVPSFARRTLLWIAGRQNKVGSHL